MIAHTLDWPLAHRLIDFSSICNGSQLAALAAWLASMIDATEIIPEATGLELPAARLFLKAWDNDAPRVPMKHEYRDEDELHADWVKGVLRLTTYFMRRADYIGAFSPGDNSVLHA